MMVSSIRPGPRAVDPVQQRHAVGQPSQQAGRAGVKLADMAEGEFSQERPQRRRSVRQVEEGAHRAVLQQSHVVDAVGAGDHAGHQRTHLSPAVGALVVGTLRCASTSTAKPHWPANATTGTSRAQETGFGSSKAADATGRV